MQSGFQGSQVLGVVPLPPLPDLDIPTAKRQLEAFKSEARRILEEANIADDLSAPLAVAAAEAENLTLGQLGMHWACTLNQTLPSLVPSLIPHLRG